MYKKRREEIKGIVIHKKTVKPLIIENNEYKHTVNYTCVEEGLETLRERINFNGLDTWTHINIWYIN